MTSPEDIAASLFYLPQLRNVSFHLPVDFNRASFSHFASENPFPSLVFLQISAHRLSLFDQFFQSFLAASPIQDLRLETNWNWRTDTRFTSPPEHQLFQIGESGRWGTFCPLPNFLRICWAHQNIGHAMPTHPFLRNHTSFRMPALDVPYH